MTNRIHTYTPSTALPPPSPISPSSRVHCRFCDTFVKCTPRDPQRLFGVHLPMLVRVRRTLCVQFSHLFSSDQRHHQRMGTHPGGLPRRNSAESWVPNQWYCISVQSLNLGKSKFPDTALVGFRYRMTARAHV